MNMDIEYGCYVSNRYDDFLNVSENESHCRNDGIIANGKQKNKSKQRKKKNSKRHREQLGGDNTPGAIENGKCDGRAVDEVAEKPLENTVCAEKEIVTQVMEPVETTGPIDTAAQVLPNVPMADHSVDDIKENAEMKWSQICIEEDKAIAEQSKMFHESGKRKVYSTIVYYNSNFGNGKRFVRLGESFRPRRHNRMKMITSDGHPAMEKSESEQTESINDCNNNDVDESEHGQSDQVNRVPKKRKHTKKKNRKQAAKTENPSEVKVQDDAGLVLNADAALVPIPDAATNGDVNANGERKFRMRNRRSNKIRLTYKSNSADKPNKEQVNEQPLTNGNLSKAKQNASMIANSSGDSQAMPHANRNMNSPAANPDNHFHTAKTTDAVNVNKPKRSRFSRRKQNATTQKIE